MMDMVAVKKDFGERWLVEAILLVFLSVHWQQRMSPEVVLTL